MTFKRNETCGNSGDHREFLCVERMMMTTMMIERWSANDPRFAHVVRNSNKGPDANLSKMILPSGILL